MPIDPYELDQLVDRPWRFKSPPLCPQCGYNLTALVSPRCPECGTPVDWKLVSQMAQEIDNQAIWLRGINDAPKGGFATAGLSGVVAAICFFANMPGLARMVALIGGFTAFGLGMSVLRALRSTPEIRQRLSEQPNFALGISAAALGLSLAAMSVIL